MKITNFLASFARVFFALAITLISSSSLISCSDSPNPEPDPDHGGGTINELNIDGSPFRISSAQYNSDKYGKGKYELRLGDFKIKKIVPQSNNPQASAQQEIVLEINAIDNGKQIAMDNSNNEWRFVAPGLECNSGGKLADKGSYMKVTREIGTMKFTIELNVISGGKKVIGKYAGTFKSDKIGSDVQYGFSIDGQNVTSNNIASLPALKKGTISFDASTNTLTLNNADIEGETNHPVINFSKSGVHFTIKFIGKTSIESKKDIAIAAKNDNALTIIGEKNASLELEALNIKFAIIASKDITLKGDKTNIKSESAVRSEKGKISIATKCSFETLRTDGAIQAYNGIEFNKSSYLITNVEDYKIGKNNENYQTIMDKDGNPLKEVVFIERIN